MKCYFFRDCTLAKGNVLCTRGLINVKCKKERGVGVGGFFSLGNPFYFLIEKSDSKCPVENLIRNRNSISELFCDDSQEQ